MSTPDFQVVVRLMREMGSPNGFDPIPPSQYLYFLNDTDQVQRVVAWTRSKTIRQKHRSTYAVDEYGNPLTIQDLANDCFNGDWSNAKRAWDKAATQNLVAMDQHGKLCLVGNVPCRKSLKSQSSRGGPPVCTDWSNSLQKLLETRPYLRPAVESLDPAYRQEFARRYEILANWAAQMEADAIAAARALRQEKERALFGAFDLPHRVGKKRRAQKGKEELVQLTLLAEPAYNSTNIQTGEEAVRISEDGSRNPQHCSGQTDASLCVSEVQSSLERAASLTSEATVPQATGKGDDGASLKTSNLQLSPPPPPSFSIEQHSSPPALGPTFATEVDRVRQAMREYGLVTHDTAARVVRECRQRASHCTAEEICRFIELLDAELKLASNPIGLLITKLPACFEGQYRELLAESPPGHPALRMSSRLRRSAQEMQEELAIARTFAKEGGV